jgi:predicted NAD/FAD-dependent oxidoreductase
MDHNRKNARHFAVIGAGMAGLSAAAALIGAGHRVTIFDKGRKPGGRLATRRSGGFVFNHGCQFATARDPGFLSLLLEAGARPWPQAGGRRYAGVPEMAGIAARLAESCGADRRQNTHVGFIAYDDPGWTLSLYDAAETGPGFVGRGGAEARYDAVILAIPAPQAGPLLAAAGHRFAAAAGDAQLAPCWALMLGFEGDVHGPDILRPDSGSVSWLARENCRPGAAARPVGYTVHASAAWSRAHLEEGAEAVTAELLRAFADLTGIRAVPVYARTHRWRYALADQPLGEDHLWDPAQKIGVCGDWCLGGKLEAAYLSGHGLGIVASA